MGPRECFLMHSNGLEVRVFDKIVRIDANKDGISRDFLGWSGWVQGNEGSRSGVVVEEFYYN